MSGQIPGCSTWAAAPLAVGVGGIVVVAHAFNGGHHLPFGWSYGHAIGMSVLVGVALFALRHLPALRHLLAPPRKLENVLDPEHPYYTQIDQTARRYRPEKVINLSEARRRARYRSEDPRRWRARLFGAENVPDEGQDSPPSLIDYPLYDWAAAEKAFAELESRGMRIQRPPIAYSQESARRLSKEAGCDWFISIEDFDHAIMHGTLEVKHVDGEQSVLLDLSQPLESQLEANPNFEPSVSVGPSAEPRSLDFSAIPDDADESGASHGSPGRARAAPPETPPKMPVPLLKKRSPSGIMDLGM